MAKKYFVWRDPACNGENVEWVELSGKEFYQMLKRRENKSRRFIRLGNDICTDADILFLETTEQQYIAWRREQNAHNYSMRNNATYRTISLDCPIGEQEDSSLYDITANVSIDVEEDAIKMRLCERLRNILTQFTQEEYELLVEIYAREKPRSRLRRREASANKRYQNE